MKILEKITLIIYSNIMLILSIILCLLAFGWLDIGLVGDIITKLIVGETTGKITLGVAIVFILLSIKCIFFDTTSREQIKERQGVLLENESGKLMISKETIENLVNSVALNFQSAEDVTTRVELDKENNVKVFVNLIVNDHSWPLPATSSTRRSTIIPVSLSSQPKYSRYGGCTPMSPQAPKTITLCLIYVQLIMSTLPEYAMPRYS